MWFRRKKPIKMETDFGKSPDDERKFVGEWIAIYDDRIIAHSEDFPAMVKELDEKYPEIASEIVYDRVLEEGIWVI
jgi:hypothetical protein